MIRFASRPSPLAAIARRALDLFRRENYAIDDAIRSRLDLGAIRRVGATECDLAPYLALVRAAANDATATDVSLLKSA